MNEFYFFITELSHIRKLKEFSRMSCGLKELRQKVYCLNSSATIGSDNSLTPLTSELAKKRHYGRSAARVPHLEGLLPIWSSKIPPFMMS